MTLVDTVKMFSFSRNSRHAVAFHICIVICINTWRITSACTNQDTPFFSTQPQDVTLHVGEDAVLNCTVSRSNDRQDSLTWQLHPREYVTKVSISFDDRTCRKTSQLSIFNVSGNAATAKCVLRHVTYSNNWQTFYSTVATVNVAYFPSKEAIGCAPQHVKVLTKMDNLVARCEVPVGRPPVNITWRIGEGDASMSYTREHSLVDENGTFFLNQTFEINRSFHSKTLSCVATSPAFFPDQEIHCTMGPFVVLYRPEVDILPSGVQLFPSHPSAYILQLTCSVNSFPAADTIAWTCHPKYLLDGCDGETGPSIALSLARNNSDHNSDRYQLVTVACSATNSLGTSKTVTEIIIDRLFSININDSTVEVENKVESTASGMLTCIDATLKLQPLDLPEETSFLCVVECHDIISLRSRPLKWYVNNYPASDGKTFHIRDSGLFGGSIMTVSLFGHKHTYFNISCETSIDNRTIWKNIPFEVPADASLSASTLSGVTHNSLEGIAQRSLHTLEDQSSSVSVAALAEQTERGVEGKGKGDQIFGLRGSQFIVITVIGIVMSILFAACLCAFCTVLLYRCLQKQDGSSDILAEIRAMGIEKSESCDAPNSQHNATTSPENIETTLDQNYEEPIGAPLLSSLSKNNCLHAGDVQSEIVESSVSCSSYSSVTSSQSADAYSNASGDSVEHDWDEHLPSENTRQEEEEIIPCDHVYHNQNVMRMHTYRGVKSSRKTKVHGSRELVNESNLVPPSLPTSCK